MNRALPIMAYIAFFVFLVFMGGAVVVDIREGRARDDRIEKTNEIAKDVQKLLQSENRRDRIQREHRAQINAIARELGLPPTRPIDDKDK